MTDSMPDPRDPVAKVAWEIGAAALRQMNDMIGLGLVPGRFVRDVLDEPLGDCRRSRYIFQPPAVPCSICALPIVPTLVLGRVDSDPDELARFHYEYPVDRMSRCPDCAWMSYETAEERARDLGVKP